MKGSGLLLGVELVLQLHELSGSFDLVGNLLPLREETLALLKGQALRSVTGDGVLLLLTANPRMQPCKTLHLKHFTNISFVFHIDCFTVFRGKGEFTGKRQVSPLRPFVSRVLVDFS